MFFLPNCLDEGDGHEATGDQFEDRTEEDTDETTPACFEGLIELFAADEFSDNGANERAKNDTHRAKEKSDKDTDCTTPHSPLGTTIVFGAPGRHDIVKNRNNDHHNTPDKQELPTEINPVGSLCNP